MHYIFQILAAMLIGISLGAVLGPRDKFLFISSLVAIALGVVTLIIASWVPLVIGLAVFLLAQCKHRDAYSSRA